MKQVTCGYFSYVLLRNRPPFHASSLHNAYKISKLFVVLRGKYYVHVFLPTSYICIVQLLYCSGAGILSMSPLCHLMLRQLDWTTAFQVQRRIHDPAAVFSTRSGKDISGLSVQLINWTLCRRVGESGGWRGEVVPPTDNIVESTLWSSICSLISSEE